MQFPSFAQLTSDRRYGSMLVLGFSSGLPLLLVYATQSAWLMDAKVPLQTIGLLSELTLAYKLKVLWAPFLDRYELASLDDCSSPSRAKASMRIPNS